MSFLTYVTPYLNRDGGEGRRLQGRFHCYSVKHPNFMHSAIDTTAAVNTTFDIETGCPVLEDGRTPNDELLLKAYGQFDRSKIDVPAKHSKTEADREEYLRVQEENYLPELRSRAALDPMVGEITAIIYNRDGKPETVAIGDGVNEAMVIEDFWRRWQDLRPGEAMVGWNNHGFDDEMIIQRSLVLGVQVPDRALRVLDSGRRSLNKSRDLRVELYGDPVNMTRLDVASRSLGGPGKNGDGAFFSELLRSGEPEKVRAAFDYIKNDDMMTRVVAAKMGVTAPPIPVPEHGTELVRKPIGRDGKPMTVTSSFPATAELDLRGDFGRSEPTLFSLISAPKSDEHLAQIYGRFDPGSVKVPKKYLKSAADTANYLEELRVEHVDKLRKRGASDGLNSTIYAIGYLRDGQTEVVMGPEREVVRDFWARASAPDCSAMVGWGNSLRASADDLIVMRSVANEVTIPAGALGASASGYRYINGVRDLGVLISGDIKTVYPIAQVAAGIKAPAVHEGDALADIRKALREDPESSQAVGMAADLLAKRLESMAYVTNHFAASEVALPHGVAVVGPQPERAAPSPADDDDIPFGDSAESINETSPELLKQGRALPAPSMDSPRPAKAPDSKPLADAPAVG